MQVRMLAPMTLPDFVEMEDAKAWDLHNRGLVSFKDEEEGLMAAIQAGEPYQAPPPPVAQEPAPAGGSLIGSASGGSGSP